MDFHACNDNQPSRTLTLASFKLSKLNPTIINQKITMNTLGKVLFFSVIGLLAVNARADDISDQWRAEFDTQIGTQKYTFKFKTDGTNVSGHAAAEVNDQKHETELKDGSIQGDTLSFVEMLNFQANDVRIRYTGKVGTNEIDFTREVGDFATENFKATRVEAATNPPVEARTNAVTSGPQEPRIHPGRDIVLGPDDKPAFPDPPAGFNVRRDNIPHGKR